MLPAYQGFRAHERRPAAGNIVFRLIIDLELTAAQGLLGLVDQALGVNVLLVLAVVVIGQGVQVIASNPVAGRLRPVKAALQVAGDVGTGADPHTHAGHAVDGFRHPGGDALQDGGMGVGMLDIDKEGVRLAAAADADGPAQLLTDGLSQGAQQLVPGGPAPHFVVEVEVVQVQHQGVHHDAGMSLYHRTGILKEKVLAVEPRQPVGFHRLDDLPVLHQLDGAGNAGSDDLFLIGLGDKVRSASAEGFRLGVTLGGQYNDRNLAERFAFLHPLEGFNAVHHRHHQIQQHQRNRAAGPLQPV